MSAETLTTPSGCGSSESGLSVASSSGLKRHNACDTELGPPPKRWYYVLAPRSEADESDGSESVHSIQGKTTDFVTDTSDTCTKSTWSGSSDDDGRMIEFEVVSFTEDEPFRPLHSKDSSSSGEDYQLEELGLPRVEKEKEPISADESSWSEQDAAFNSHPDTSNKFDKAPFYKFCLRCKDTNKNKYFRYCPRCYKLKKKMLSPRPRGGRKKRLKGSNTNINNVNNKDSTESGISILSSQSVEEYVEEPSQIPEATTALCNICMIRPKDGGFWHGRIIHNYSCYRCSVKVYNLNGRCPVCNINIKQVFKIIM